MSQKLRFISAIPEMEDEKKIQKDVGGSVPMAKYQGTYWLSSKKGWREVRMIEFQSLSKVSERLSAMSAGGVAGFIASVIFLVAAFFLPQFSLFLNLSTVIVGLVALSVLISALAIWVQFRDTVAVSPESDKVFWAINEQPIYLRDLDAGR